MSTNEQNLIIPEPRVERDRPIAEFPQHAFVSEAAAMAAMIERAAKDPSVDVDKMTRLWEFRKLVIAEQKQNEREENERKWNNAMNAAQAEMTPIATDMTNTQTRSNYASYAQLDRAVRPIYTAHGFALVFYEGDSPKADHVRVFCDVSHTGGFSRPFYTDMPADGKGAKGGDVMTKTHAAGAAKSYGKRYILRDVFNLAIGEADIDGNDVEDEPKLITASQAKELDDLIAELKADKAKFLKYIKADSLGNILASSFETVKATLETKRKQKGEA